MRMFYSGQDSGMAQALLSEQLNGQPLLCTLKATKRMAWMKVTDVLGKGGLQEDDIYLLSFILSYSVLATCLHISISLYINHLYSTAIFLMNWFPSADMPMERPCTASIHRSDYSNDGRVRDFKLNLKQSHKTRPSFTPHI